jgi:hypothetical protein
MVGGHNEPPTTPCGGHTRVMFVTARPCKAPVVNGSEGLLIVLGVVAGGSLIVYAIVKLTDRW